jgi:hypothetical protein
MFGGAGALMIVAIAGPPNRNSAGGWVDIHFVARIGTGGRNDDLSEIRDSHW